MEQVELNAKIDALGIEYRRLNDMVVEKRSELSALQDARDSAIRLTDEEKSKFTSIVNQISEEKLAWNQERDSQYRELESKKEEVEKVLLLKDELAKAQVDIESEKIRVEDLLKINNQALLDIDAKILADKSIEKQVADMRSKLTADIDSFELNKQSFKVRVKEIFDIAISELNKI